MIQKKNLKLSQKLSIPEHSRVWVVKTPEDLLEEKEEDRKIGRFYDSGGESILYSRYYASNADDVGDVVITSKNPEWDHWHKKPSFLVGAYSEKLRRNILFTLPKK